MVIEFISKSNRAGFCVGYFNLRGWEAPYSHVEQWPGDDLRRVCPEPPVHLFP